MGRLPGEMHVIPMDQEPTTAVHLVPRVRTQGEHVGAMGTAFIDVLRLTDRIPPDWDWTLTNFVLEVWIVLADAEPGIAVCQQCDFVLSPQPAGTLLVDHDSIVWVPGSTSLGLL